MPITGKAIASIFKEIIWAVTVVPIFAPMITLMAWDRVIKPALAKPTTITVVAPLLWISIVINKPVSIPMIGRVVSTSRTRRSLSPATLCIPVAIIWMPNKKSPRPPTVMKAISCIPARTIPNPPEAEQSLSLYTDPG